MDRLTELGDVAISVMTKADRIAADLERDRAGQVAAVTLRRAESAMGELDRTLRGLRRSNLPDNADATLAAVGAAVDKFGKLIERLDGGNGLVAATQHSVAAFGDVEHCGRQLRFDRDDRAGLGVDLGGRGAR